MYYIRSKKSLRRTLPVTAHWAETDYGLSAGQHAVLPEGKGTMFVTSIEHLTGGFHVSRTVVCCEHCCWSVVMDTVAKLKLWHSPVQSSGTRRILLRRGVLLRPEKGQGFGEGQPAPPHQLGGLGSAVSSPSGVRPPSGFAYI